MINIMHIYDNSLKNKNKFVPISIPLMKKIKKSKNDFFAIGDIDSNLDADYTLSSIFELCSLILKVKKYDRIVLHSCMSGYYGLLLFIVLLSVQKEKIYMVLQGGEVNFIETDSIKNKIIFLIRKIIMKRIGFLVTNVESDYYKALSLYNIDSVHIDGGGFYLTNVVYNACQQVKNKKIMIGNSAHKRNNHKDIIKFLEKEAWISGYECIIPLSYGDSDYAKDIERYAKERLPCKVTPLYEFMSLSEYLTYINDIEIAFFYHDGQQGMGNIYSLLGSGAKIYLKDESYKMLSNMGFIVYQYNNITNEVIEEHVIKNIDAIIDCFSEKAVLEKIEAVLS